MELKDPEGREMETILFTGGCRSGKSMLAQRWVEAAAARRAFVATARMDAGNDAEMRARVARHQADRGEGWVTIEPHLVSPAGPLDAVAALEMAAGQADAAVFDCVTLWLAGWLFAVPPASDEAILREADKLADWLVRAPIAVALVSNEVGYGIVPEQAVARRFRDLAGFVNQRLAAACTHVTLAVCGLPLQVK